MTIDHHITRTDDRRPCMSTTGIDLLAEDLHAERIQHTRDQMLAELARGVDALQDAASHLHRLRALLNDIDFAHSRDGRDVAAFIDEAVRCARASYAVAAATIAADS